MRSYLTIDKSDIIENLEKLGYLILDLKEKLNYPQICAIKEGKVFWVLTCKKNYRTYPNSEQQKILDKLNKNWMIAIWVNHLVTPEQLETLFDEQEFDNIYRIKENNCTESKAIYHGK